MVANSWMKYEVDIQICYTAAGRYVADCPIKATIILQSPLSLPLSPTITQCG